MKRNRIKQLLDEILTEIDVTISKIDCLDDYCIGEEDGLKGAAKIVEHIGSKYLKEGENKCYTCGFNDEDYGCTCPHSDKWYACPIENKKPENNIIRNEIIGMLTILKKAATETSHNDTMIIDVKEDSFKWVIDKTIDYIEKVGEEHE